jgi:hypothetical protein
MTDRVHMSHGEYLAFRAGQILEIIERARNGQNGLFLAVRKINGILHELPELERKVEPSDFLFLTGVDSECDGFPLGEERQYWAPDSLKEKDVLIAQYEAGIREKVVSSFLRIADRLKQVE